MDRTDIIRTIQGLLNYCVNPKKRLREKQQRQVFTAAKRVLRELRGGDPKAQVVPPRKGSETQCVVKDADYYFGRGDHYDLG